jgi:hypothetical protein
MPPSQTRAAAVERPLARRNLPPAQLFTCATM